MRVWLVRHGEAASAVVDAERELTAVGRESVQRLAAWCEDEGVRPDEILHSGIVRAAQTAQILAARLSPPSGVRAVRGLAPSDEPLGWFEELPYETQPLMLVTHMPFVSELAALLAGRRAPISFATAEVAEFERDGTAFRLVRTWSPSADS